MQSAWGNLQDEQVSDESALQAALMASMGDDQPSRAMAWDDDEADALAALRAAGVDFGADQAGPAVVVVDDETLDDAPPAAGGGPIVSSTRLQTPPPAEPRAQQDEAAVSSAALLKSPSNRARESLLERMPSARADDYLLPAEEEAPLPARPPAPPPPPPPPRAPADNPRHWFTYDNNGTPYFHNATTGVTTYDRPPCLAVVVASGLVV